MAPTETRIDVFMMVLHTGGQMFDTFMKKQAAICPARMQFKVVSCHSCAEAPHLQPHIKGHEMT
jgi:hypothetical protein